MKLSQYKKENNLSFEELSIKTGISKSRLHRICSGRMDCLRVFEIPCIVSATNGQVSVEDLLEEAETC
jgi:transcriptional regulator with XRE-family HTH domain